MARQRQIVLDRALRGGVDRDKADLGALAPDPEVQHTLAAVQVLDPKPAELFAADAVIERLQLSGDSLRKQRAAKTVAA
jgi:hypothetical protein